MILSRDIKAKPTGKMILSKNIKAKPTGKMILSKNIKAKSTGKMIRVNTPLGIARTLRRAKAERNKIVKWKKDVPL